MHTPIVAIALAGALSVPAIASANHDTTRTSLGEVSADPRDGRDVVDLHGQYAALELRAREDRVRLHGVQVRFTDGHVENHRMSRILVPGDHARIELPHGSAIESLVIDYGDRDTRWQDRTTARLELYGIGAYASFGHGDSGTNGRRGDTGYRDRRRWR